MIFSVLTSGPQLLNHFLLPIHQVQTTFLIVLFGLRELEMTNGVIIAQIV